MGKIIKKSVKYLIILIGIIIMFPTMLYLVVQIPVVQTGIVKRITGHLSRKLQSEITVGKFEYKFFNRLSISNILFKDINNDTLFYAERITAGIRKLDIRNTSFGLGRVNISHPVFSLITDTTGQMNLNWYIEKLRSRAGSTKKPFSLEIDRVDLNYARFSLINKKLLDEESKMKVNFNDLRLSGVNGVVENFTIRDDTVSFNVYDLAFHDKSGFSVNSLNTAVTFSGTNLLFESLYLKTDSSMLNFGRAGIRADSSAGFKNFTEEVRLDILTEKSSLNSSDLGYFLPVPEELKETLLLSGKFTGTISELRGRDVNLVYRNGTILDCDFDLSGLPDIDNTFIYIGVNKLKTNIYDVKKLSIQALKDFIVPEVLYRLGDITFSGSFTGFTTDFVTYGEFRTNIGNIRTDISLRPEKSDSYRMKGLVSGNNISLGELTGSDKLGRLSLHTNVNGYASSFKQFAGSLTGRIDSIEINDYNYRNIALNGSFTEKTWDGNINIADENIRMDLLGMFNFNDTLPEFDFTMNLAHADLYRLNFDKADSTSALSMILTSNFRGSNIDELDGEIKLLSSTITKHGETMELYDFSVRTFNESYGRGLSLRTDFINADIRGNYNFRGLKHMVSSTMSSLMPSLFTATTNGKVPEKNNFTFEVNFRNTDRINDFFKTGVLLAEKSYIKGSVVTDESITIEGMSPSVTLKNLLFTGLSFNVNSSDSILDTDIKVETLTLPGNTRLADFSVGIETKPDQFFVTAGWDNNEKVLNDGTIVLEGSIAKNSLGKPVVRIDIDSTQLHAGNNLWTISRSTVTADSSSIKIDDIHIASEDRFYHVRGAVSENTSDTLHLQFKGINISPLNYLGSRKSGSSDTAKIQLNLDGQINGQVAVTNIYKNILLESDIVVNDFSLLGSDYGDISVSSAFDYNRKVVEINASNDLAGAKMFDVSGYYDPAYKKVMIDFIASKLPVDALNPLLSVFASEISGFVTGKVNLSGPTNNLVLEGSVLTEKVTMKIDFLQTKYTINDLIRFDRNGFRFNNVRFTDEEGKQATITGTVFHRNFRDYAADLTINTGTDFLVLNTQIKHNPSFYGKVYASDGVIKIRTGPDLLSFDISATTGRNSKFFIPLTDELSVSEYSFISFIDSSGNNSNSKEIKASLPAPKQLGIDLDLDLTVTSDAVARIIFDETVGDMITGSGSGILNISLDPKGNLGIRGDYTIEQGDYLFTLGNILNKQFAIENGGKIMFKGDLEDAEIELKAIYNGNVKASLFPVLQEERFSERRYSVEPQLLLSGKLFNPTVDFEIELPNADEEAKAYLKNAIASDEEMSRQFMYLLVIGEFYSEQSSSGSSASGTTTMAATTFEMLSNQLSNWISQISNDFDLGFTYRPGSGNRELDPDEVQIAFETQVLDDRVILNGNFDYRGTSGSTDQLTGDFEAELKLTEKLRFKVFNRFNDTYSGRGPYTQGVGIFFREDFEKLTDLFRKRTKPAMKKEEEITLKDQ